jgi:hypothetical protein
MHKCHKINVDNGLFADNNIGIDINRAEGIEVNNTIISMKKRFEIHRGKDYERSYV